MGRPTHYCPQCLEEGRGVVKLKRDAHPIRSENYRDGGWTLHRKRRCPLCDYEKGEEEKVSVFHRKQNKRNAGQLFLPIFPLCKKDESSEVKKSHGVSLPGRLSALAGA